MLYLVEHALEILNSPNPLPDTEYQPGSLNSCSMPSWLIRGRGISRLSNEHLDPGRRCDSARLEKVLVRRQRLAAIHGIGLPCCTSSQVCVDVTALCNNSIGLEGLA